MAIVKNNVLVEGLSGMIGGQIVFRTFRKKTFVSAAPRTPKSWSDKQKSNRNRLKEASVWAKKILLNPSEKARYQSIAEELGLPNAYTAACTDYLRYPQPASTFIIDSPEEITVQIYPEKKGFEIEKVETKIVDESGELIGVNARPEKIQSGMWQLKLNKEKLKNVENPSLIITSIDKAGKEVTKIFSEELIHGFK